MTDDPAVLPVPEDRGERVRLALDAALEALRLARREAEAAGEDAARLRWAALGLVSALQGALVAALSGYDTADTSAVLNPSQPDRIAPVALLLRRARSAELLNAPERVEINAARQRALERLIAVRNGAVHALPTGVPETFGPDARVAAGLLRFLVLDAPAFDPHKVSLLVAGFRIELDRLEQALTSK